MDAGQASGPTLDILTDIGPLEKGPKCDIAKMRRQRPELAAQYDRAFSARRKYEKGEPEGRYLTDEQIARWLTEHGWPIGAWTVKRHRNGECRRCQTSSRT